MDESSTDGAQEGDNSVKGNTGTQAQIPRKGKRKRVAIEKTPDKGTSLAATTSTVRTIPGTRGHRRDNKRSSTRGRSLPMALKARVGRPAPQATDSSDDASDAGVQIRPQALTTPVDGDTLQDTMRTAEPVGTAPKHRMDIER